MIANDEILGTLAEAVRRGGEGVWLAVGGRSMGTGFTSVREIRVVAGDKRPAPPGTLVVFQRDGRWVVHRVMTRRRESAGMVYQTKGDGLAQPDAPEIRTEEVRGVVDCLRLSDGAIQDLRRPGARLRALWIALRFRIRQRLRPLHRGQSHDGPA